RRARLDSDGEPGLRDAFRDTVCGVQRPDSVAARGLPDPPGQIAGDVSAPVRRRDPRIRRLGDQRLRRGGLARSGSDCGSGRSEMKRYPVVLLIVIALALILSGLAPYDRTTWWLEIFPILIGAPILVATHRRFPLTSLVYTLLAVHALILIVGGHYTDARVPLGFWLQALLVLARSRHSCCLLTFTIAAWPTCCSRNRQLRSRDADHAIGSDGCRWTIGAGGPGGHDPHGPAVIPDQSQPAGRLHRRDRPHDHHSPFRGCRRFHRRPGAGSRRGKMGLNRRHGQVRACAALDLG